MGDDQALVTLAPQLRIGGSDSPVEAKSRLEEGSSAKLLSPLGNFVIVADDCNRQGPGGPHHVCGHLAGEIGTLPRREDLREAHLGIRESLDGDDDGRLVTRSALSLSFGGLRAHGAILRTASQYVRRASSGG